MGSLIDTNDFIVKIVKRPFLSHICRGINSGNKPAEADGFGADFVPSGFEKGWKLRVKYAQFL
jgi:hypothetical protein